MSDTHRNMDFNLVPTTGVPLPVHFELYRFPRADHIHGYLKLHGEVCQTVELPWRDNARSISAIPDGVYKLQAHTSPKFGKCLLVTGVPNRSGILFHVGNVPAKDSRGCILPAMSVTPAGHGINSRRAFDLLMDTFNRHVGHSTFAYITIKSMNIRKPV